MYKDPYFFYIAGLLSKINFALKNDVTPTGKDKIKKVIKIVSA